MLGSLGLVGSNTAANSGVPWALAADAYADFDFVNNRGFQGSTAIGTSLSFLTVSRASIGYIDNSLGMWNQVAAGSGVGGGVGARRSDKGLLVENARTNIVLWCRDLTNSAWIKTNATIALDQTGIDNGANSASSILATAGNATVLQSITNGSSARWQTAFVKRIVGAGEIDITMDGGVTWTAIQGSINSSSWVRVSIPTQTLANPQVGFRIVTNGDKIAVDFVQNEGSSVYGTSPILTTTTSATRAADNISLTNIISSASSRAIVVAGNRVAQTAQSSVLGGWTSSGGFNEATYLDITAGNGLVAVSLVGGVGVNITASGTVASPFKAAMSIFPNSMNAALNGTTGTRDTSHSPSSQTVTVDRVGSSPWGADTQADVYITRLTYFITSLSDTRLSSLST